MFSTCEKKDVNVHCNYNSQTHHIFMKTFINFHTSVLHVYKLHKCELCVFKEEYTAIPCY